MTNAESGPAPSAPLAKARWSTFVFSLMGLGVALLCLRQWNSADPWARLDLYSGVFFASAFVFIVAQLFSFQRIGFRSRELAGEVFGISYDPGMLRWGTLLSVLELVVVLDYSHWHLVPALENRGLQMAGLILVIACLAWMLWTDQWLTRHFSQGLQSRRLMTDGPFGVVRHPRYLGALVTKLAYPLVFASILGWVILPLWVILVLRRIRREETHVRKIFGAEYDAYAHRTRRLLPGIY